MPATAASTAEYRCYDVVDTTYDRAVKAGAASIHGVKQMDYGERAYAVRDPCGNTWYIATYTGPA